MSDIWFWGLLASLILLAISTSLKSAYDAFLFKQSDKEVARLLSKIEALNQTHNETISAIQQSNSTAVTKLTDKIKELEKQIESQKIPPYDLTKSAAQGKGFI